VSTIAGVHARVAAIRSRLSLDNQSSIGSAAASTTLDIGRSFDPFGAAYQEALSTTTAAAVAPTATSEVSTITTDMTTARRVRSIGDAGRTTAAGSAAPTSAGRGGSLSGEQIARFAYDAGFRGEDLVKVVAISKRESNWKPSAYNGNAGTGDASYGLMQINMLGGLGPARLEQFGLSSYDQLLDPQTNMNAAFTLYTRSGNTLHAWGGYKGMSDTFGTDLAAAQQVVNDAGLAG